MDETVLKKGIKLLNEKKDIEERLQTLSLEGHKDYYLIIGNESMRLKEPEIVAVRNLLIQHYEDCLNNVKKEIDAL